MIDQEKVYRALTEGKMEEVKELTQKALRTESSRRAF